MEKLKLDVQKFKSLPSCKDVFGDGEGNYCTQGKILAASGIECYDKVPNNDGDFRKICVSLLWETGINGPFNRVPAKLREAADINNSGKFEEADALALEWAVESGKFELVNLTPDPVELKRAAV